MGSMDAAPMANRTIPSSCFSLIFVSPRGGCFSAGSCAALLEPCEYPPAAQKLVRTLITLVLLPLGSARLLYCSILLLFTFLFWPRLRRRNQLLHYLASGFPPHRIFHVFTEYDGIAGDLFHAAVEHLVVLTQEIRMFGAVGDYRHHFPGHVFDRAL